ncbi:MAG: haloacid dehalogenase [Anaerolinea sp.]|nr:haloacid dehalogenase [Anaerolinea sp.]
MDNLDDIVEKIRASFEARNKARDQALAVCRLLTRHCAHAIRAVHRQEIDAADTHLLEAAKLAAQLYDSLSMYPELYYAGYTQDALKEYSEATITRALILNLPLPSPKEIGVEDATWLNGLAEVTGELRRRCMDILRQGYSSEAERLLACMDDIYSVLVTIDYPDAVTNGLRRHTDLVRGIVERTRGDLTISQREHHLQQALAELSIRLDREGSAHADH